MKLRRKFMPHRPIDICCFGIITIIFPLGFLTEMYLVLPVIYEPGSFMYNLTLITGWFIFLNVMFNFTVCMVVDTSVDAQRKAEAGEEHGDWRHCQICDCWAPPHARHCKACNSCILKKDHHCLFTGCCIGLNNARYFMCFLAYLIIGSIYSLIYLLVYLYHANLCGLWASHLLKVHPLFFHLDLKNNIILIVVSLDILLLVIASGIFHFYLHNIFRGGEWVEKKKYQKYTWNDMYNRLLETLGNRMHVAWICPLIESQLPNDGYTLVN